MSAASLVWTLSAWLFAAACVGFGAAWLVQHWRMEEGLKRAEALRQERAALALALAEARAQAAGEDPSRERSAREAERADLERLIATLQSGRADRERLITTLQSERADRVRELAGLRAERDTLRRQLGAAAGHQLELEHTVNRLQLEALAREQAHTAALAVQATAAAALPGPAALSRPDDEELLARRVAAQRQQELEDGLARARRQVREHRAEVVGLKGRIQDLESRLAQLWAQRAAEPVETRASGETDRHPA